MLRTRAIVTLIGTPLVFFVVYLGGWLFFAIVTLIMAIGVYEYSVIMKHMGWSLRQWLLIPFVILCLLAGLYPDWQIANVSLALSLIVLMLHALWQYEIEAETAVLARWFASVGAIILFGWMGSHLLLLRSLDVNGEWAIATLAMIFAVDVGAYLVGRQWGKRPLVPRLSPKKSVEGYVGGLILGVPLVFLFKPLVYPSLPWEWLVVITVLFAIIMPAGDLFFSLVKREAGVKDASKIIPGHGGVLDRLDTILWGSTIAYYLLAYLVL